MAVWTRWCWKKLTGRSWSAAQGKMCIRDRSNGSVSSVSAADFIGVDNGAGARTGIQSFIDNDEVSIMAVPGVTDPNVQLALVAHCENLASRFAVLDMPREAKAGGDIIAHREDVYKRQGWGPSLHLRR